ncbi:MAG: DUF2256 domain-containing protein [Pseudomonadota bacterium]
MRSKGDLAQKDCAQCGRPFAWRKKWEKVWDEVRFCSERCRAEAKSARASARARGGQPRG